LSGGFVGVDVFFVLSGFLVTQVLLRDIATVGSVRLARFYARRFRRLLPAAFAALLVTAAVFVAIASPAEAFDAIAGFKAAFLYSANWFLIHRSTAYFGGDITKNPVLHFWSLAVEEQFYLVWPLLLGAIFHLTRRLGGKQLTAIRIIVAVGAFASLVCALALRNIDPNQAYYGTEARAYQLWAGALLALAPALFVRLAHRHRVAQVLTVFSLATLLVLASSWVPLDTIERGVAVTLTTCVLILAIESVQDGPVNRLLSSSPVVYLGKISYGTYLWHWLVILVMLKLFDLGTTATIAIVCLVVTGIASLSFQLLERPVREARGLDGHHRAVIISGLAISAVSALVLIPAIVVPGWSGSARSQGNTAGFTPVPTSLDWRDAGYNSLPLPPVCVDKAADDCTIVHGTGRHILLIGDSHAQMLIPAFTKIARQEHLTLSVAVWGGCPWQRDLYTPTATADCVKRKEDAYTRVIPALRPDLIVAAQFGYDDTSLSPFPVFGPDRRVVIRGTAPFSSLLFRTTLRSVKALRADGRDLVIIEPIPVASSDPTACLKTARVVEDCRYVVRGRPSRLEMLYRRLAGRSHRVWSADFDRLVCPYLPICDPVIAGHIVKVDVQHLTLEYSEYIADDIDAYLKANGLIPPAS
jgi:peptidoglycan/LPS O-acetylase OafA/YrhL